MTLASLLTHGLALDTTTDATTSIVIYVVFLAIIVLMIASEWVIFSKAGKPGWAAIIPIYNLIGLARTAKRLNEAHARVGSPTRVGVFVACLFAPWWFASQTRYLQRRLNILHDVLAAKSVGAGPAMPAVATVPPQAALEAAEDTTEIGGLARG